MPPWFRAYYNSYEIPLKYWPGLWGYIESHQFEGETTGPWWLYRWGARPLFRFIKAFAPDVVAATEVGLGEIAIIHKRDTGAQYSLVGIETFAFERPWAKPEVDLYVSYPGEVAAQVRSLGVPPEKILECGVPVDPAFGLCPDRPALRERLGLPQDLPVLLVNFGGSGKRKPREVVSELQKVQATLPGGVHLPARRKPSKGTSASYRGDGPRADSKLGGQYARMDGGGRPADQPCRRRHFGGVSELRITDPGVRRPARQRTSILPFD